MHGRRPALAQRDRRSGASARRESHTRLNRIHPLTTFRVRVTGPNPGTTYYCKVSSADGVGTSDGVESRALHRTGPSRANPAGPWKDCSELEVSLGSEARLTQYKCGMSIQPARPASTVVLLRPSPARFEVFLVRRHDNVAFMGGAHVFPGGRVDDADRLAPADAEAICDGVDAAVAKMNGVSASDAVGHHVAGIRELFEEAGVLFARRADGRIVGFRDPVESARFRTYRTALASGSVTLRAVAEREALRIALDELSLFAHWRTPEIETKRFDTRFFVALLPDHQDPVHDEHETIDSEWIDPADALARCRRDDIMLPPPTWTTLQMLAEFTT